MRILAALALTLAAAAAGTGTASANAWNTPASSCPIVEGRDLAEVSGATVRFASGKVGVIRLMCPVTDVRFGLQGSGTLLSLLGMSWQDSTGLNEAAVVTAEFKKTPFGTGIATTIAGLKSNEAAAIGQTSNFRGFPGQAIDFSANVYHVELTLERRSTAHVVSVTGVRIGILPRVNPV